MSRARDVRIKRLFNPEYNKSIAIPIDHGFYLGNPKGLEDPFKVMQILVEEEDHSRVMVDMAEVVTEVVTEVGILRIGAVHEIERDLAGKFNFT